MKKEYNGIEVFKIEFDVMDQIATSGCRKIVTSTDTGSGTCSSPEEMKSYQWYGNTSF